MSNTLLQLVLGGFGVSGVIGAGVALFKLRPEVNQLAVTSMGDAAGEWRGIAADRKTELDATELERDAWRERAIKAETELGLLKGKG